MGCRVTFSKASPERRLAKLFRLATRVLLGFDYIHARNNAAGLLAADVVWTHTEAEHLSAALLLLLKGRARGNPMLLAQSVWLVDKWAGFGALRKRVYKKLLARADVLTTHASENAQMARGYFKREVEQVFYGINPHDFPLQEPTSWQPHTPVRIGAIGNDRDRDWVSLVQASRQNPAYEVRIATRRRVSKALHASNVKIAPAFAVKSCALHPRNSVGRWGERYWQPHLQAQQRCDQEQRAISAEKPAECDDGDRFSRRCLDDQEQLAERRARQGADGEAEGEGGYQ